MKFPELPPKYSSSRELRNKAEKIRRDRLNGLIDEMKMLVPIICDKWVHFWKFLYVFFLNDPT